MSEKAPLEKVVGRIWMWLGERWSTRAAILLLTVAGLTWITNAADMLRKLAALIVSSDTYATSEEINCLNEWVLNLSGADTQSQADQMRARFLDNYQTLGHVNADGEPIWKNNVHVVRDIEQQKKWLVVIDMYPGASSKQCMDEGRKEMLDVLNSKAEGKGADGRRSLEDTLGPFLNSAEPLCYDFAKFEKVNGKILNKGSYIERQKALGPCANKLQRASGQSCEK